MAVRIPKQFVPLHVDASSDPKLVQSGPWVELLYYRALQWCKKHPETNGHLPTWALPEISRGVRDAARRMHEGSMNLLWTETSSGWTICAWKAWNSTAKELEEAREARVTGARIANHKQGRHKKRPDQDCPMCKKASRSSERSASRYSDRESERSSDAEVEVERSTTYSSTSRTGRDGAGAPPGPAGEGGPDGPWPHHPEDWNRYGEFEPTDYQFTWDHPEQGGWDHNSWRKPSVWRDGWGWDGKRPRKPKADGEGAA